MVATGATILATGVRTARGSVAATLARIEAKIDRLVSLHEQRVPSDAADRAAALAIREAIADRDFDIHELIAHARLDATLRAALLAPATEFLNQRIC